MRRHFPWSVLFLALTASGCETGPLPADLVFRGGVIHTMDRSSTRAEAVAVRDGVIVYVGDDAGLEALMGPSTRTVDLAGRVLLPGFIDTHVHPASGGIEAGECDLNGLDSSQAVLDQVAKCAADNPSAPWVRGGGFDLPLFPDGAPSRELLDSLVPDRPVYLTSSDAHTAWVNSRALALAGVTKDTPDPPPDGVIVRGEGGEPQGTLRESAMDLVSRYLPEHTDEEVRDGLRRGLRLAASLGITTVFEASADESYARAYRSLDEMGELTARAIVALRVDDRRGPEQVADLVAIRDRTTSRNARPVAAKIFLDGVIEGQTAALLEPYVDRPGWRGELNIQPDDLVDIVSALDDAGFKVHVHAIGDRAVRAALDAFERRREDDGGAGPMHLLAHIQLIDPDDIPRFAELGVAASFQPLWMYADRYITELTEPRLGPARSRWLYPTRSVFETGAVVVGGSDWSVTSMDPLLAIETAVTRRDPFLDVGASWIPEERADVHSLLVSYTRSAAIAGDLLDETGTIEVGKSADLVVLNGDLYAVEPERISDLEVDLTVFEGRVVYEREPGGS